MHWKWHVPPIHCSTLPTICTNIRRPVGVKWKRQQLLNWHEKWPNCDWAVCVGTATMCGRVYGNRLVRKTIYSALDILQGRVTGRYKPARKRKKIPVTILNVNLMIQWSACICVNRRLHFDISWQDSSDLNSLSLGKLVFNIRFECYQQ